MAIVEKILLELHNPTTNSITGAKLSAPNTTDDYLDKVAIQAATYREVFGNDKKNHRRPAIVKITSKEDHTTSIWREATTKGVTNITMDNVGLPFTALLELGYNGDTNNNEPITVFIQKGCRLYFLWNHPSSITRIPFKICIISLAIGVIGVVITMLN